MISGETLRLIRIMKGAKQETVAKGLGISQPAYCKMEQRHCISEIKFAKILAVLKCSPREAEEIMKIHELKTC